MVFVPLGGAVGAAACTAKDAGRPRVGAAQGGQSGCARAQADKPALHAKVLIAGQSAASQRNLRKIAFQPYNHQRKQLLFQ